jgi:hypothetical protein
VLGAIARGAQALGSPGFVSKTFLSFYAVLLCEVLAAVPRVSEDLLTLLLPALAAGLGAGAAKEYRGATCMVLAQLLRRAQLAHDFLAGACAPWARAWGCVCVCVCVCVFWEGGGCRRLLVARCWHLRQVCVRATPARRCWCR